MTSDLRTRLGVPVVRAPLPVSASLAPVFCDGGLVRGRTVHCSGDAALSIALLLSATATRAGSWLAVVGVPNLGISAAVEAGVAVERLVLAHPPHTSREWITTVAALVEGFEVIIAAPPPSLGAHDARRLQTRIAARQAVLITVDRATLSTTKDARVFVPDVDVRADTIEWSGIERGGSHITRRSVRLRVDGRRHPASRECVVTLPCPTSRLVS